MKFGSLFSGIGGFDIALERCGMEVGWQVELDDFANSVLEKHWPDTPRWRDVKTFPPLKGDWDVDLVCGGFPCQSVSHAGERKGSNDDRWLWPEMRRVCEVVRPRWVLAENVVGLLSAGDVRGDLFGGILRDLAALGYGHIEWHCLSARAIARAPHIRDRVWILATTGQHDRPIIPGDTDVGGGDARPEIGDVSHPQRIRQSGPGQPESPVHPAEKADREADRTLDDGVSGQWGTLCRLGGAADGLPVGPHECRGWECGVPRVTSLRRGQSSRLKLLGNSVVPQVVEFIGSRIMDAERGVSAESNGEAVV